MPTTKHEEPRGPRTKRQPRDPGPDRIVHKPTDIDNEKRTARDDEPPPERES